MDLQRNPKTDRGLELVRSQILKPQALLSLVEEHNGQIFRPAKWESNALTPILAFPNEISMKIFHFACEPSRVFFRTDFAALDHSEQQRLIREEGQELALSHVCHSWREISLGCSELWSSFNHFQKYSIDHVMDRLTAYLERARSKLLDLWANTLRVDDMALILKMIKLHSLRWRQLSLTFDQNLPPATPHRDVALNKERVVYDNLETIDIYLPGGVDFTDASQVKYMISNIISPKLRSLRMDRRLLLSSRAPKVYQNTLSVLQLDSGIGSRRSPWTIFLSILLDFPGLTSLSLSHLNFDPPRAGHTNFSQIRAVTVPNLQYFRCADKCVATWMWIYFRAPQLKLLAFREVLLSDWYKQYTDPWILDESRERLFPSLETLSFTNCLFHFFMSPDGMASFVHAMRNITRLNIVYSVSSARAQKTPLHWMTQLAQPQEQAAWPNLETVSILRHPSSENLVDEENISGFLEYIAERKRVLNKVCQLRMHIGLAREWEAREPDLWNGIEAEGLFESMPPGFPNDSADWVSYWPPRDETNFHWTSEASFSSG